MTTSTSSNKHQGESSEEGTTFRSVPLQQTLQRPTVLPRSFHKPSFAKLAPAALPQTQQPASAATGPIPTWTVSESCLPQVHAVGYPLERTALPLQGQSLKDVTANVMTVLHKQGVTCTFVAELEDEVVLPGRVDCTRGDLKFVLQLYADDMNGKFVLEVQRRAGSCVELHAIRRPLFQTLLGKRSASAPPRSMASKDRRFPLPLRTLS